jgi:REP element-mobilizing transposase RayT
VCDYTEEGNYFITICTGNREEYFGRIKNGKMIISPIGKIANELWNKLPNIFPNIILDEFIVMPDHMHGIIIIKNNRSRNTPRRVPTNNDDGNPGQNLHPLIKYSISSIINHYKGSLKKWCNKNDYSFKWQARFHDRIIRDYIELYFVQKYISNNPMNWIKDKIDGEKNINQEIEKLTQNKKFK